ncbi:divalent-cation tolerance protein CutA [Motilimonas cestriensis]|uniref:Divalent-cation tolerance protein CutA n=1 Tax=Motilimonas cestriensis TaxID=2742685 RepID=A0ABS8W8W0_9GAMM|nr:divalent-cation tolerance protein CutA [Motilimonas cestriensis]MCE2594705.1 divalent-cation tolerance protein CutA [Motilimonas cestriensis]
MQQTYIMVLCSAPDSTEADKIAGEILREKLAACITMQPNVYSLYHWQGEIQQDREVLMMIKTTAGLFDKLSEAIKSLHSYDTPEIIALPITQGEPRYLNWIDQVTQ